MTEWLLAGLGVLLTLGTALFVDPTIPVKIADGLSAYLERRGLSHVRELVGQLRLG